MKKDINYFIEQSNTWLKENRPNAKKITLQDVKNRLNKPNFLSLESTKTKKGEKYNYMTGILYLAPAKITGFNFCVNYKNCFFDCLFNSGRGKFKNVTRARIIKSLCFLYDRNQFIKQIDKDILRLYKKATKKGFNFAVRLNGTSDLNIQYYFKDILKKYSYIQFYDYTKVFSYIKNKSFDNYHLTFSYDGSNFDTCLKVLNLGFNVSIVFEKYIP